MPAKAPAIDTAISKMLQDIAHGVRQRRLALGVSATVAAHTAGMSRVTWHRIEKAQSSVTMGAYLNAMNVIGLDITLRPTGAGVGRPRSAMNEQPGATDEVIDLPARIALQDFPQLRQIAWHVKDGFELTQAEAYNLYERNRRHLDMDRMPEHELKLLRALENSAMKGRYAV